MSSNPADCLTVFLFEVGCVSLFLSCSTWVCGELMQFRFPGQFVDYNPLPLVAVCHPVVSMMLVLSVHAVIWAYPEMYFLKRKHIFFCTRSSTVSVLSALVWFLGSKSSTLGLGCLVTLFRKELSIRHHCISERTYPL